MSCTLSNVIGLLGGIGGILAAIAAFRSEKVARDAAMSAARSRAYGLVGELLSVAHELLAEHGKAESLAAELRGQYLELFGPPPWGNQLGAQVESLESQVHQLSPHVERAKAYLQSSQALRGYSEGDLSSRLTSLRADHSSVLSLRQQLERRLSELRALAAERRK